MRGATQAGGGAGEEDGAAVAGDHAPRHRLGGLIKNTELKVDGKSTNKEEFVTCGGIPLAEVDFKTMASRLCPGLYLAGEVLDIDGVTGGFNFQAAWTTGRLAGLGLAGEPGILARLVAGPWHPAFGNMARSIALLAILEARLRGIGRVSRIFLPARLAGELWGHGRANAPSLEILGITKETAAFWQEPDIVAELEE